MRIAGGQDFQKANPSVKDIMDKYYKPSVKDCKDIMDKYYEMFLVRTRQTKKTFSKVPTDQTTRTRTRTQMGELDC
jgi:predicted metal-binding protein